MQAIILSVRPPWARQLVTGEKTVELRKRRLPGDGGPVRALIYETKAKGGCGALIGEVVLRGMMPRPCDGMGKILMWACVTMDEASEYSGGALIYPWRLSKPIEYATTRRLEGRPSQSYRWAKEDEL